MPSFLKDGGNFFQNLHGGFRAAMIVFADHDGLFTLLHFDGNELFSDAAGFVRGIGSFADCAERRRPLLCA